MLKNKFLSSPYFYWKLPNFVDFWNKTLLIHFVRNSFVRGSFVRTVAKHYFRRNYEKSLSQKIQRKLSFVLVWNENFSFVTVNTQRKFVFLTNKNFRCPALLKINKFHLPLQHINGYIINNCYLHYYNLFFVKFKSFCIKNIDF